ncbi:MAG TPA: hypothetical protein VN939_16570 [Chthoniobacterales bacterium]|nr:hypothetical protein [Chthoniobacterales bacterium]
MDIESLDVKLTSLHFVLPLILCAEHGPAKLAAEIGSHPQL